MGCDIHVCIERQNNFGRWSLDEDLHWSHPLRSRCYALFGFLADVRNYSAIPPIAPRRGIPPDASEYVREQADGMDNHSHSWLTIKEILDFNWDATVEDRRVTRGNNGGCTCDPGEGKMTTYREIAGEAWLNAVREFSGYDPSRARMVFWFDN